MGRQRQKYNYFDINVACVRSEGAKSLKIIAKSLWCIFAEKQFLMVTENNIFIYILLISKNLIR